MDFSKSMAVAASGMRAQTERMKIIAENIANANSTSPTPGGDPYRRKIATIKASSTASWAPPWSGPAIRSPTASEFRSRYDPGNPNADAQGYVKLPNVDSLVEIMDMREAQRSYEADLTVMDSTKQMLAKTVDLLRDFDPSAFAGLRRRAPPGASRKGRTQAKTLNGHSCSCRRRLPRRRPRWRTAAAAGNITPANVSGPGRTSATSSRRRVKDSINTIRQGEQAAHRPGAGQGQPGGCGRIGERRRNHPGYGGGGARQGRAGLPVHHEHADLTERRRQRGPAARP